MNIIQALDQAAAPIAAIIVAVIFVAALLLNEKAGTQE